MEHASYALFDAFIYENGESINTDRAAQVAVTAAFDDMHTLIRAAAAATPCQWEPGLPDHPDNPSCRWRAARPEAGEGACWATARRAVEAVRDEITGSEHQ